MDRNEFKGSSHEGNPFAFVNGIHNASKGLQVAFEIMNDRVGVAPRWVYRAQKFGVGCRPS